MSDRYRGGPHAAAARFNPTRSSMPTSIGYSSMYAGDMHFMPAATTRHHVATPRAYAASSALPTTTTTTRTYTVASDRRQRSSTREAGRRRSTLDSASRPLVIVTTTTSQMDRPHAATSHSSNKRSGSPIRDDYRASDGQLYAQPASSIRSRSSARPYHDDLTRHRDRTDPPLSHREVEAYRSSRPFVAYPSDPRHSTAAIDYGDDGYQYTNAGELARYDLDLPKSSRPRRHESMDRGYYRPNINYNADQRSFNVNTSHDLSRNYNMNTSRPYEGARAAGPPPSTLVVSTGSAASTSPPANCLPPLRSHLLLPSPRPCTTHHRRLPTGGSRAVAAARFLFTRTVRLGPFTTMNTREAATTSDACASTANAIFASAGLASASPR